MSLQFVKALPPIVRRGDYRVGPGYHSPTVAALKRHAGQWALVGRYRLPGTTYVQGWRLREYGCDTRTRRAADGFTELYARWPLK